LINSGTEEDIVIFFSVDIIGSTAYKNSKLSREWGKTFKRFFSEFPDYLDRAHDHKAYELGTGKTPDKLKKWKTIGDEIVFTQTIKSPYDALFLTDVFKNTLIHYRKNTLSESKYDNISLKGSAWLAIADHINTKIVEGEQIDYIGPSIDTGFRISKLSTNRKFTISVELALALLTCFEDNNSCKYSNYENKFIFYYDGEKKLKGVLGGKPYPIIWLDTYDNGDRKESLKGIVKNPCGITALKSYVADYCISIEDDPTQIKEQSLLIPNFIRQEYDAKMPAWYIELLQNINDDSVRDDKSLSDLSVEVEEGKENTAASDEIIKRAKRVKGIIVTPSINNKTEGDN